MLADDGDDECKKLALLVLVKPIDGHVFDWPVVAVPHAPVKGRIKWDNACRGGLLQATSNNPQEIGQRSLWNAFQAPHCQISTEVIVDIETGTNDRWGLLSDLMPFAWLLCLVDN